MRILHISPLEEQVPPIKYGGTELVVRNIIEAQVAAGHEVFLMASGDSQTSAQLIPLVEKALRVDYGTPEKKYLRDFYKIYKLGAVLKHVGEIKPDIVHNHMQWRLLQFAEVIKQPLVSTMHGPLTGEIERIVYQDMADQNYISISQNQRLAMPDLNWVGNVYNGLDLSVYPAAEKLPTADQRGYFAFLGRMSPEKGVAEICQLIKQTDFKLKIAAKIDVADLEYYETQVKPLIDGKQIEYIGEIDHAGKVELLSHAKALLLWQNWEEPFGMVFIESMACGAPVITNHRGSASEVVAAGSGVVVDTLEQMLQAMKDIGGSTEINSQLQGQSLSLTPQSCRARVDQMFSKEIMAEKYVEIYKKVVASSSTIS